jgi:ribosome-associated protein
MKDTALSTPSPVETPVETETAAPPPADALAQLILGRLDDDQAQDVITIDLQGLSPLADAIVIASGRSGRHVSAIADHLLRALKDGGYGKAQVEGLPQADWVLIDAGDIIVHLFRPEVRAFYNIEKIWSVEPPASAAYGHHSGHNPAA